MNIDPEITKVLCHFLSRIKFAVRQFRVLMIAFDRRWQIITEGMDKQPTEDLL
ncbi:MAG: hypothetical protein R6V22_02695 [Rhodohalobacter sp.]|uniref:hypothetical protein n=1 Tax=Rhodohalobacter sp. TaxID=1974210 RepID=UPI00397618CD